MATGFSYRSSLSVKSQGIDQVMRLLQLQQAADGFDKMDRKRITASSRSVHHLFESIECASQSGRGTLNTPATQP
jgi:hypothetical protein